MSSGGAPPNADADWKEFATGLPGFVEAVNNGLDQIVHQAHQMSAMTGPDAVIAKLTGSLAENLYDVLFLCENNRKDGALRLLRTPFEKYLYAHHMTRKPEAAEDFQLFDAIHARQLVTAVEEHYGYRMSTGGKAGLDALVKKAQVKFNRKKCKECGDNLPRMWTNVTSDQMAAEAGLGSLHVLAFRYSTMFIHPSERGITDQMKDAVKIPSILVIVHRLILETLILQWRRLYKSETMRGKTAEVASRLVKVIELRS